MIRNINATSHVTLNTLFCFRGNLSCYHAYLVALTFGRDLNMVRINPRDHIGQNKPFRSKVIVRTDRHRQTDKLT